MEYFPCVILPTRICAGLLTAVAFRHFVKRHLPDGLITTHVGVQFDGRPGRQRVQCFSDTEPRSKGLLGSVVCNFSTRMQPREGNSTEEEGGWKGKQLKCTVTASKVTSRMIVAADVHLFQGRNFVGCTVVGEG